MTVTMTRAVSRRWAGALLLTTVLLTAGCATAVTGTADPASTSDRGSAVSPVLPSAESTTDPSSSESSSNDAPSSNVPPNNTPPNNTPPSRTRPDDPTSRPGTTVTDPTTSPAAPTDLPTVGTTRPSVTSPGTTTRRDTTPRNTSAPRTTPGTTSAPAGLAIDHFTSPSGNITCLIAVYDEGPMVRCDLAESNITQEHDCRGTGVWGRAVSLLRGTPASMICVSDAVTAPGLPVLAYGDSTTVHGLTCTSRESGMTCGDDAGLQFLLSRNDYEVK